MFPFLKCIASLTLSQFSFSSMNNKVPLINDNMINQPDGLLLCWVSSNLGRLRSVPFSSWKIFLICSTQISAATSVSLARFDRLRKPWGRSSTTVRLTGWPMSRSFLANITESSSKASRAEACEEESGSKDWKKLFPLIYCIYNKVMLADLAV